MLRNFFYWSHIYLDGGFQVSCCGHSNLYLVEFSWAVKIILNKALDFINLISEFLEMDQGKTKAASF
jgi:hypothetical protein